MLALAGGLYAAFPATVFRGDGLSYAELLLEPGPGLWNPNHLLYGSSALGLHRLMQWAGFEGSPMVTLQVLGILTGMACLALFFGILRRLGIDVAIAAGFTLCLSFTRGFWLQTTSPETFLLSMALEAAALMATLVALQKGGAGTASLAGISCALAVLGTQVDFWLCVCLFGALTWDRRPGRARRVGVALASFATLTISGFVLAWYAAGSSGFMEWFLGRARTPAWFGFSPTNLLRDARHLLVNLLPGTGSIWEAAHGRVDAATLFWCLTAVPALALLALLSIRALRGLVGLSSGIERAFAIAISAWLLGLVGFFTLWANHLSEFWATPWIAIWLLIALGASRPGAGTTWFKATTWALAALLGTVGLVFGAWPLHSSDQGRLATAVRGKIGPGDRLIVCWDEDLRQPVANLGVDRLFQAAQARATFAVNARIYLGREVEYVGCWIAARGRQCLERPASRVITEGARTRLREGRKVWLLRIGDRFPSEGLSDPDLPASLEGQGWAERILLEGEGPFSGTTLFRLHD